MSARSRTRLPRPLAAVQHADDAGLGDPRLELIEVEGAQPLDDEARGVLLLEAQFGVLVEVAAVGDHAGGDLLGALAQFGNRDHRAMSFPY